MADTTKKLGISSEMPRIIEIELTKLRPNPDQPRKRFDEETIKSLLTPLDSTGLFSPFPWFLIPTAETAL